MGFLTSAVLGTPGAVKDISEAVTYKAPVDIKANLPISNTNIQNVNLPHVGVQTDAKTGRSCKAYRRRIS